MKEYGRCAWSYIKDLLLTVLATVVTYAAVSLLLQYVPLGLDKGVAVLLRYGVPALVCAGMLYLALVADAVRLTLRRDGQVNYHRAGAKTRSWDARNAYFDWVNRSQTSGNTTPHDITLRITELNGEVAEVDCSPLGRRRFAQFMQDVKGYALWRRPDDIPPRPVGETILPTGAPLPGQMGAVLTQAALVEAPPKAGGRYREELAPEPEFQLAPEWELQEEMQEQLQETPAFVPPVAPQEVVAPTPIPVSAPEPIFEPVPEFTLEPPPQQEPTPEPEIAPEPEPVAAPVQIEEAPPAPLPEPEPEPAPEPKPEHEPGPEPEPEPEPQPPTVTQQFVRPILPGDPPQAAPADVQQGPPQRTQEFALPKPTDPVKPILPGDPLPDGNYDVPPPPAPPLIRRRDTEEIPIAALAATKTAEQPAEAPPAATKEMSSEQNETGAKEESSVVQFAAEKMLQKEEEAYWQTLNTGSFPAQPPAQPTKDLELQDELQKMLERLTGEIPIIQANENTPSPIPLEGTPSATEELPVPAAPQETQSQDPASPQGKRKIRWRRKKSDE